MSELLDLLCSAVKSASSENEVALLLSAGIDSVSVGVALSKVGKIVRAYTYELQGYPSKERAKAEAIARHLGWPLHVVTVPTTNLRADFLRLAIEHRCRKKVHFEVLHPLLYIIPQITETEIWTGWNADDHYGNSRKDIIRQWELKQQGAPWDERKKHFDNSRESAFNRFDGSDSLDTWWCARRLANHFSKRLFDAYNGGPIRDYFGQCDHEQLSRRNKPIVRAALAGELVGLESTIAIGIQLHKGGGVDVAFRTLLNDPAVNRFEPRYLSMSPLCQRWGREVEADHEKYKRELTELVELPRATTRLSCSEYQPYTLADVREASKIPKFTVASTFTGGGGSCVGYRLAGGVILVANEFVPEAARTYRTNFPECAVDQRDIREILRDEGVEGFLERGGASGEPDICEGSPPCLEYSVAGKGISDQDILRSYSDVKQKSMATLPFDCVELAKRARSKIVIIENVPAFAWPRSREIFERVLDNLRFVDGHQGPQLYYVNWSVLVASDFGVPQRRRRLFIIGIRKDVGDLVGIDSDESVLSLFPAPTCVDVTIRSALANLRQTSEEILPWITSSMTSSTQDAIRLLPKNPARPTRLNDIISGYAKSFTLTRCSWDAPAPTLVVTGQRPDGMTGAIHPDQDRKFTLPELKRLTALPDDFVLTGTISQAAERICRMVPPPMTKAIAESVYRRVLRPYAEKRQ